MVVPRKGQPQATASVAVARAVPASRRALPTPQARPNVRPLEGQSSAAPLFIYRDVLPRFDRDSSRSELSCIGSPHPPVHVSRDGRTGAGRYVPAYANAGYRLRHGPRTI